MRKIIIIASLAMILNLTGCGDSEIEPVVEAPERAPMELHPNPPMSSQDIDNIVNEKTNGNKVEETESEKE